MVFCAKCGETIPENANFCPKCGVKTSKGKEANISPPWEDVFSEVGEAIKNALSIAGREIEKAFKTAKEGIRNATTKEYVVCSNCGEKNRTEAQFCHKCGKSLA
jgi:predicted amidophosphoribosyltransferase